jgi:PQQ-dependent catabolism-associated CXXCW motif protein
MRTGILALMRELALAAALSAASMAAAQDPIQPGVMYGEEDRDWDVAPTKQFRTGEYHAPTPREIPGGRVVTTYELSRLLEQEPRPFVIDVLGGSPHRTIAGAFWMSGAGAGDMSGDEAQRFQTALANFAGGDKNRPLVFFCVDPECWLSYNAALRAIAAGYTNVMWYRGGVAAWRRAGQLMTMSEPFGWNE